MARGLCHTALGGNSLGSSSKWINERKFDQLSRPATVVRMQRTTLDGALLIPLSSKDIRMKKIVAVAASLFLAAGIVRAASHTDMKDIVATAQDAGSFTTLVAAVEAAGLVETLQGEGPFTVFAPTDEAFAALPEGTVEDLLKPENKDQLAAILTYHVVPGKIMSTDLSGETMATTVEGSDLTIDATDGVTVNGATVTSADIEASNGVIHVIDQVVMPPM